MSKQQSAEEVLELLTQICPQVKYLVDLIQNENNPFDYVSEMMNRNRNHCPYFDISENLLRQRQEREFGFNKKK